MSETVKKVILILFSMGIFWGIGMKRLDPDFGLHYATGKWIIENGGKVPLTDPFSYTMPSFPVIVHEWLMQVGMVYVYDSWGRGALSLIFALMFGILLWLMTIGTRLKYFLIPSLLALPVFFSRGGVRPQVLTALIFGFLIWVFRSNKWNELRFLLPLLFVLWANMHAGFVLGLVVLGLMMMVKFWEEKRIDIKDVLVLVFCFGSSFVTPYSWKMWYEMWMTMSDPLLKANIAEWQPFYMSYEMGFVILVAMTLAFMWFFRKKIHLVEWALVLMTMVGALSSVRHGTLFAIVSVPIVARLLGELFRMAGDTPWGKEAQKMFYRILFLVVGVIFVWEMFWVTRELMLVDGVINYPVRAVEYIKENPVDKQLFSEYGWGGYLVWKLPEYKVFIDGRMPSWRWEDKSLKGWEFLGSAPNDESNWIFKEYIQIGADGKYKEIFDRYGVNSVLLSKVGIVRQRVDATWLFNKLGVKKKDEEKVMHQILRNDGWKLFYEDNTSVVLVRPD